jgi:hypothetical protein
MNGLIHPAVLGHYTGGFAPIQGTDLPCSQLRLDNLFQKIQRIGLVGIQNDGFQAHNLFVAQLNYNLSHESISNEFKFFCPADRCYMVSRLRKNPMTNPIHICLTMNRPENLHN